VSTAALPVSDEDGAFCLHVPAGTPLPALFRRLQAEGWALWRCDARSSGAVTLTLKPL
jgi:hypothetical protein